MDSTVFAVIGGFSHEGEDFNSLELFSNWDAAEAYRVKLSAGCHDRVWMGPLPVRKEAP